MSLIVDSSVAVKWVADEPGSDRARALYLSDECWAPALIMVDVGNALWKKCRMKLVTFEQATAALRALPDRIRLFDMPDLAPRAFALAADLDHPIYDCFYLALAERERVPLVCADGPLVAKAKKVKGIEVRSL
ncbi:MAG: type II toxin-antitoxin system VapC family toxin [Pseudolabrys sp.]